MSKSYVPRGTGLPLRMRRILIAEDSGIIAAKLSRIVIEAGGDIVGPAATVASAMNAIAAAGSIDAGLLDVDLRGEPVYDVAEALIARRIPLLFVTGYDLNALPEPWREWPLLRKPFASSAVVSAIQVTINAGPQCLHGIPTQTMDALGRRMADAINTSRNLIMERHILRDEPD